MKLAAIFFLALSNQFAYAQLSTPATSEEINQLALHQTQAVMTNPQERKKAMENNANAKKVDQMVSDIMGDNGEDMYKSAAEDFMPYVMKMADGDPKKMNEFIQQALRNPAAFEKNLPPELKAKIADLAGKAKPLASTNESQKLKVSQP